MPISQHCNNVRQSTLAQVQADEKGPVQQPKAKAKTQGQPKAARVGKQLPLIEKQLLPEEFGAAVAALPEVAPETEYTWPPGGRHSYAPLSGMCDCNFACKAMRAHGRR